MGIAMKLAKAALAAVDGKPGTRGKVIASSSAPEDRCFGCGKRVRPDRGMWVQCCGKPACARRVAETF
jgi:hypothetical protein